MTHHEAHLKNPWFEYVKSGMKTFEGRVNVKPFNKWKRGDTVTFFLEDHYGQETGARVTVTIPDDPIVYSSFDEFIEFSPLWKLLPAVKTVKEAREKYAGLLSSRSEEIKKYGMLAIPIEVIEV